MTAGRGLFQFHILAGLVGLTLPIPIHCWITTPYFGKEEDEGKSPGVSFNYRNYFRSHRRCDDRGLCPRERRINV